MRTWARNAPRSRCYVAYTSWTCSWTHSGVATICMLSRNVKNANSLPVPQLPMHAATSERVQGGHQGASTDYFFTALPVKLPSIREERPACKAASIACREEKLL